MENRERLNGVDLARGLAVLFMIMVHVLEVYANNSVKTSVFGEIILFLGGPPAAPVFMMLMGLSFAYSKKKDIRTNIIRGLKVFISGYILNLLRGVLPVFLIKFIDPNVLNGMTPEQTNLLNIFLVADILQFAGIALIIISILRELKVNIFILIGIAFTVSLVSAFLWGTYTSLPVLSHLLDLFVGDKPISGFAENLISFPVFPWITFPLIGMVVGEIFSKSENISKSHRNAGIFGFVIMVIGLGIVFINPEYHMNDYYHSRQGFMIFMSGFVLLWLYFCHILTSKIPANIIFGTIYIWSKFVTPIYFIQWILMVWCIAIFDMSTSNFLKTILIMVTMIISTHFINILYQFLTDKFVRNKTLKDC